MEMTAKDLFDDLAEELDAEDPFNQVQSTEESTIEGLKSQLTDVLNHFDDKSRKKEHAQLKADFEKTLKEQISKIKPVQNVIERQVEQIIKHEQIPVYLEPKIVKSPPQIIKETRVEVQVEKKDLTKYAQEEAVQRLEQKIQELQKELEK